MLSTPLFNSPNPASPLSLSLLSMRLIIRKNRCPESNRRREASVSGGDGDFAHADRIAASNSQEQTSGYCVCECENLYKSTCQINSHSSTVFFQETGSSRLVEIASGTRVGMFSCIRVTRQSIPPDSNWILERTTVFLFSICCERRLLAVLIDRYIVSKPFLRMFTIFTTDNQSYSSFLPTLFKTTSVLVYL